MCKWILTFFAIVYSLLQWRRKRSAFAVNETRWLPLNAATGDAN